MNEDLRKYLPKQYVWIIKQGYKKEGSYQQTKFFRSLVVSQEVANVKLRYQGEIRGNR
jgi:hypothetical protein